MNKPAELGTSAKEVTPLAWFDRLVKAKMANIAAWSAEIGIASYTMTFAKLVESYGYVYDALILRLLGLVLYTVMVGLLIFAAVRYVVFKSEPPLSSRKKLSVVPPTSIKRGLPRRLKLSKRKESPLDTTRSDRSSHCGCFQAKAQSPGVARLHERTRSQGPFLRWGYPASSVIRPCPTPAGITTQDGVGVATLMPNGSPPITPITRPACRAHYPGGSNGGARRLLAHPCGLPPFCRRAGVRVSTFEVCSVFTRVTARRIAQPPKAAFVTRLRPSRSPVQTARQLPDQSTILRVGPSFTGEPGLRGTP